VWRSPGAVRLAEGLVVAGSGALFLDSAGTVQVGYTVRPSYALFAAAIFVGAPLVWRGWRGVPGWVRGAATGIVVAYVLAAILGDYAVLESSVRGDSRRSLVYLMDLVIGLGVVGLLVGMWREGGTSSRRIVWALSLGAVAAAAYGLYQWPAQHWGWPLSDVNNTLDSNGLTSEGLQGAGLFGWERIRGTFLEPHFLAAYLASMLPFIALLARRWRRAGALGVALVVCALILTVSLPSWAVVLIIAQATVIVLALSLGWVWRAGTTCALLATTLIAVPLVMTYPELLSSATGRSTAELSQTTDFRTGTWTRVEQIWARRPVLGYGPGQSSIRLAKSFEEPVLVSAQGVWAAALIDGGVLGLSMLVLFLGGVLVAGARALYRSPTPLLAAAFAGAGIAVFESQTAGDRLRLPAWVLIGLLLAAAQCKPATADPRTGDQ
jgi:hypothetical protein